AATDVLRDVSETAELFTRDLQAFLPAGCTQSKSPVSEQPQTLLRDTTRDVPGLSRFRRICRRYSLGRAVLSWLGAGVAELVDAAGLGPAGLRSLEVRVLSPA